MRNNKVFGIAVICIVLLVSLALVSSGSVGAKYKINDLCVGGYGSIQEAIDDAHDGDRILIPTGTYNENLTIDRNITLQGGWSANCSSCISTDPADTVIDGGGSNRVITIDGSYAVTIEGLTIGNGDASGQGGGFEGKDSGGGIYARNAMVTMENCIITDNVGAWDGGGMFLWNCDVILSGNHIFGNQASNGAGLYLYQSDGAELTGNLVYNNTADNFGGGGLSLNDSDATLDSNNIYSNDAAVRGGGLAAANSNLNFANNTFNSNTAGELGAGLDLWYSSATFDSDVIQRNTAGGKGGGLYSIGSTLTMAEVNLTDNTASNTGLAYGGGAYLESLGEGSQITNCMIENNTAAGDVSITECSYGGGLYIKDSAGITISGNTIEGNAASLGDASQDVEGSGGGVYAINTTMDFNDNQVLNNIAGNGRGFGGGLYLDSIHGQVNGNTIQGNIGGQNGFGRGGGAYIWASDATVHGNTIKGNIAGQTGNHGYGGGLSIMGSNLTLSANTIIGNKASGDTCTLEWGGGIFLSTPYGVITTTLINNIVAQNEAADGAGIYILNWGSGYADDYEVNLYHNTLADNSGDGVKCVGSSAHKITLAMTNNIVSGHNMGISTTSGVNATIDHTLFFNNTDNGIVGTNPVYGDPAFVGGGNYHITATSAAIDAGVDAGVTADIDGQTRPRGGGYDIGADEFLGWMAIRQEFVWDKTSGTFRTVNLYATGYVEDIIADLEEVLTSSAAGDGLILGRDCGFPYYYWEEGGSWHTLANRTRYKGYDERAEAVVTRGGEISSQDCDDDYTRVASYAPWVSIELANGWKVDVTQEYTDWGHEVKITAPLSEPPPPYRVSYVYGDPHLLQADGAQQQELAAVGNYVFDLGGYTLDLTCMKSHDGFSLVADLALSGPNDYILTVGRNGEVKIHGGTDSGDPQAKPSLPGVPEIQFIEAPSNGATLDASGVSIKVEANEFLQNAVLEFGGQNYPMTDMDGGKGLRWEKPLGGLAPGTYSFHVTGTDLDDDSGSSSEGQVTIQAPPGPAIAGVIREVNCAILPGTKVELFQDDTPVGSPVYSGGDGNYALPVPEPGEYDVVASKEGFRDETQPIEVVAGSNPLDFCGSTGLIPNSPDVFYVLDCIANWQYPPETDCCHLDVFRVLDVIAAWQYPVE